LFATKKCHEEQERNTDHDEGNSASGKNDRHKSMHRKTPMVRIRRRLANPYVSSMRCAVDTSIHEVVSSYREIATFEGHWERGFYKPAPSMQPLQTTAIDAQRLREIDKFSSSICLRRDAGAGSNNAWRGHVDRS